MEWLPGTKYYIIRFYQKQLSWWQYCRIWYGKTFLLNAIIAHNWLGGKSGFACRTTRIASLLLHNAQTAHYQFNIPLKIHEKSTCSTSKSSPLAEKIKSIYLILWDKAPVSHHFNLDACNQTIQYKSDDSAPFAHKKVILADNRDNRLFYMQHQSLKFWTHLSNILNSGQRLNSYIWQEICV